MSTEILTVVRTIPSSCTNEDGSDDYCDSEISKRTSIQIKFSHHMINLTEMKSSPIPNILITPAIEGTWGWDDTQILEFRSSTTFTMSTEYTVTVPAKTHSLCSNANELSPLEGDYTFSFKIRGPTVSLYSTIYINPDFPLLYVTYYNPINPEQVFPDFSVCSQDGTSIPIRLMALDEVSAIIQNEDYRRCYIETNADSYISAYLQNDEYKKYIVWFTFVNREDWGERGIKNKFWCMVGKKKFTFTTLGKLSIVSVRPKSSNDGSTENSTKDSFEQDNSKEEESNDRRYGLRGRVSLDYDYYESPLRSYVSTENFSGYTFEYTNLLDDKSDVVVEVTPEIDNMNIIISNKAVIIKGNVSKNTYNISVSNVKDIFGQMAESVSVERIVSAVPYGLKHGYNSVNVFDTSASVIKDDIHYLMINVMNIPCIKLVFNQVHPKYKQHWKNNKDVDESVIIDKNVVYFDTQCELDKWKIVFVPIEWSYLQYPEEKLGHLIVEFEGTEETGQKFLSDVKTNRYKKRRKWLQLTQHSLNFYTFMYDAIYGCVNSFDGILEDNYEIYDDNFERILDVTVDNKIFRMTSMRKMDRIYVKVGNDISFIESNRRYGDFWTTNIKEYDEEILKWYVFNDRGTYNVGDMVSIKGIVRKMVVREDKTDVELVLPESDVINYTLNDYNENELLKGTTELNANGEFSLQLQLPEIVEILGEATVELNYKDDIEYHSLTIEEFKAPKFIAKLSVVESSTAQQPVVVKVKSTYYDGGDVTDADVIWKVRRVKYQPKPIYCYEFELHNEIDVYSSYYEGLWCGYESNQCRSTLKKNSWEIYDGVTDTTGSHYLEILPKSPAINDGELEQFSQIPMGELILLHGTVIDTNQVAMDDNIRVILHSTSTYVGIQKKKNIYCGEPLPINICVCDIDKHHIPGVGVEITIAQIVDINEESEVNDIRSNAPKNKNGDDMFNKQLDIVCSYRFTSKSEPVNLEDIDDIRLHAVGEYHLYAKIDYGGVHASSIKIKVIDKPEIEVKIKKAPKKEKIGLDKISNKILTINSDECQYDHGQIAEITVNTPFDADIPCEGVVFASCLKVLYKYPFRIEPNSKKIVLNIPITDNIFEELNVYVAMYGRVMNDRYQQSITSYSSGGTCLTMSNKIHDIDVNITPEHKILVPGQTSSLKINAVNVDDTLSLNATIIIVDIAHLNVSEHDIRNPLQYFNETDYFGMRKSIDIRDNILMCIKGVSKYNSKVFESYRTHIYHGQLESCGSCTCDGYEVPISAKNRHLGINTIGSSLKNASWLGEIDMPRCRSNFNPMALFVTDLKFDENGELIVPFTIPDSLTKWKIWCVVTKNSRYYGLKTSEIVTRMPFTVESSVPNFMNLNDTCNFTAIVNNRTDEPMEVKVICDISNDVLELNDSVIKTITITPKSKKKVNFSINTKQIGSSVIKFVAIGLGVSDGIEDIVEVKKPVTVETYADYGILDSDKPLTRSITRPDCLPNYGGLSVTMSSTAIQKLTDAFIYLYEYQYDCTEQCASRILSIVILGDIFEEFNIPQLPSKSKMTTAISTSLRNLVKRQHEDGGFKWWSNAKQSSPYLSLYTLLCLTKIKDHGIYIVSVDMYHRSHEYAINLIQDTSDTYSVYTQHSLKAFAMYILSLCPNYLVASQKEIVLSKARKLAKGLNKLTLEGLCWLLYPLATMSEQKLDDPDVKRILSILNNRMNETASTVNFVTNYSGDDGNLIMLHSNRRTDGVILDMLCRLQPPLFSDIIPKIVKGLMDSRIKGRWYNTQENSFILMALKTYYNTFENIVPNYTVSCSYNTQEYVTEFHGRSNESTTVELSMNLVTDTDLNVSKHGDGRLYWRIGVRYVPSNLQLDVLDRGYGVTRTYIPIEGEFIQNDDGFITMKLGSVIRVQIILSTEITRYHSVLVDHIPAGCTTINPTLGTSVTIERDPKMGYRWYQHVNYRTNCTELFPWSKLGPGSYYFSYNMRCTSSGTYNVSPTYAEEMYSPENFGRSSSTVIKIVE